MQCYTEEQWWQLNDGFLDAEPSAAMDAHRRACPRCAALWGEIRTIDGGLRALAPKEERCNFIAVSAVGTHLRHRALRRIVRVSAVAAGIAAAVLLVSVFVPRQDAGDGSVVRTTPAPAGVLGESADGIAPPAADDNADSPETLPRAAMQFAWGTVSAITSPDALAVVRNARDSFCARLSRGSARFEVDPAAGTAVAIETPDAVIEVVGTVFSVAVRDEGRLRTEVTVERGKVRVVHEGEAVIVVAGESFPPRPAEIPGTPPPSVDTPGIDVPSPQAQPESPSGTTIDMPSSVQVEY